MQRVVFGAIAALALASTAQAQALPRLELSPPDMVAADSGGGEGTGGTAGSVLSGRTVGNGADVFFAQFGWPGLGFAYLHGAQPKVDFGGSFTFDYGYEGTTHTNPGLKLAGVIRLGLVDNGKFNLGLRFDPGITMYFRYEYAFGISTPVQLALGVAAGDAIMINFGVSLPMTLFFTQGVVFTLPILTGVGAEYHVDSHLSVTLNTGFGPELWIHDGTDTEFAFLTQVGIAYKL